MAAKVYADLRQVITTSDGLAKCFDLTRPRIIQLAKDGILNRDKNARYQVQPNILAYINYIRKQGAEESKQPTESQVDYWQEKALHERDKRALTEIVLAKKQGQIHDAKDVELVMTEMLTNLRSKFQGFPATISPRLEGQTQEQIYEILTREIEKLLSEISDYDFKLFDTELVEDEVTDQD